MMSLICIGKTHRINREYKTDDTMCFSINDKLNLSSLISSFLLFDSITSTNNPSVYFNISIHAPFEELNRILLSLFICGSFTDKSSGLTFSLSTNKIWKFIIEIPYTNKYGMTIKENFNKILPLLSIISPSNLDEVTDENYQLFIGEEEELVARFLKAYEDKTIDQFLVIDDRTDEEHPVKFDALTNHDECRKYIYNCMIKYAPELPRNKIYELSFTKFLYRRIRFFTGHFYCLNMTIKQLGSVTMKQMIEEAKYLTQIDFRTTNYPRVYLVYGQGFSLQILHDGWNNVSSDLKQLFNNVDISTEPEFKNKDYYVKCLSWLMRIQYDAFEKIMIDTKFILTSNFAYKLFHIHERKLTKLALIIEGDTGVGKTFLLKFYSLLLNVNVTNGQLHQNIAPRILERTSLILLNNIIGKILDNDKNLLRQILHRIKPKLSGLDDDDDENKESSMINKPQSDPGPVIPQSPSIQTEPIEQIDTEFLEEIKRSLTNYKYDKYTLQYIWKMIMTISNENSMEITQKLILELHNYVTSQLSYLPLVEASFQLQNLLNVSRSSTFETAIQMFNEYLSHTRIKPLFYRLLLHPGVTEEQLEQFMNPISQLARELPNIELVVFFDEVNTASCLGLFKEMFMDRTLHGISLPTNIFFTAAINPAPITVSDDNLVHRRDYLVHQLPQSLENLKVSYGPLESKTLSDYINKKIATFEVTSSRRRETQMPLEEYAQNMLANSILKAQEFCEIHLGIIHQSGLVFET